MYSLRVILSEPNYPAINPFPKSAPLPPSEKATAIPDVFKQQYGKTDVNGPTLRSSNSKSSKHWRSAEQEASIVHVSSVIHPDNFYPQNKRIVPNGLMPRDAFVISNDPLEAFVHSNNADDSALGPITNPAAYFLQGAHLDKVTVCFLNRTLWPMFIAYNEKKVLWLL